LLSVSSQAHGKLSIQQAKFQQLIIYHLFFLIHRGVYAKSKEIHCSVLIGKEDPQVCFQFSFAKNYEILFHTNQLNILKAQFNQQSFLCLKI